MSLFTRLGGWKRVLRYEIRFDRPKTEIHSTDDPALARKIVGDSPPTEGDRWIWIERTRLPS
jgi:hypothetical protein